jgi:Trk K+ transport system NAD-binding subunit
VSTITPSKATVTAIGELVSLPSLFEWRETTEHRQQFAEETVVSDDVDGKQIGKIEFPDQAVIVLVQRGGEFLIPTQETVLLSGDRVTILGRSDGVKAVREALAEDH